MDLLLCDTVLEVWIDSTISESLMLTLAVLNEALIHELTIVGMIVVNVDSHVLSKALEAVLGLNSFGAGDGLLQINVDVS